MPDIAWIPAGFLTAVFAYALSFDVRRVLTRLRTPRLDFDAIESYANDPRHAARSAYIEARARRDARTQSLVQGATRNPPRAVGAAEAASHDKATSKETAS